MSRKANYYENGATESLGNNLKSEIQKPTLSYENLEELSTPIFLYLEDYSNPKRLHSSIGSQSPNEFIQLFSEKVFESRLIIKSCKKCKAKMNNPTLRLQLLMA